MTRFRVLPSLLLAFCLVACGPLDADRKAIEGLRHTDTCAVFGALTALKIYGCTFGGEQSCRNPQPEKPEIEIELWRSRLYGDPACRARLPMEERLVIDLKFSDVPVQPRPNARAVVFLDPGEGGTASRRLKGLAYQEATLAGGNWFLRLRNSSGTGLVELDEALKPMGRLPLPLPPAEFPCGLNQRIVELRRELVEEGEEFRK